MSLRNFFSDPHITLRAPTSREIIGAFVVVLLLGLAFCEGRRQAPTETQEVRVVHIDTLDASAWHARADSLARAVADKDGLLASLREKLAGHKVEVLVPTTVYETRIQPETVIVAVQTNAKGALEVTAGAKVDSAGYQPQVFAGSVADCDRGFTLVGTRVECKHARFGHLSVLARAVAFGPLGPPIPIPTSLNTSLVSGRGELALRWSPKFRSTFAVEAAATTRATLEVRAEKGLRLW